MTAYRAAQIWTGEPGAAAGKLLRYGIIEIDGDTIVELRETGSYDIDLGDVVILPGLINAHTHLEFSLLSKPLEPRHNFPEWIRAVIGNRIERNYPTVQAIRAGLHESVSAGITSLGEIATSDWRVDWDTNSKSERPEVVMFREYFGLADEMVHTALTDAEQFLSASDQLPQVSPALSPHAPYSVHPEMFRGLCQLAGQFEVPLAMHLAETRAELELLESGTGVMVDFLTERGVWRPGLIPARTQVQDYLDHMANVPQGLIIHGNYLTESEIAFIARHPHLSVVYCPRTHAAMQPDQHPWRNMIAAGANVALGTDSRASNPDLSIWEELKFLKRQNGSMASADLLKLATINGARALGLSRSGMLAPGLMANFCVVAGIDTGDPELGSLLHESSKIVGTMQRGRWTCYDDKPTANIG